MLAPYRRSRFTQTLAKGVLRLLGWRTAGETPELHKFVLVCAPHTSRWDLWLTVLSGAAFGLRVRWLGKQTLFRGPSRLILEWMGGVAVDRAGGNDAVARIAAAFAQHADFALAISPEGAKRWRPHWRSGFWYIAQQAKVPLVVASLDWKERICRLGPVIPTTTIEADIAAIRDALKDVVARHPERFGPIELEAKGSDSATG